MNSSFRSHALSAGLLGFAGVVLGALGAHGKLHDALVAAGTVDPWRTAVQYHLIHAVALVALAGWPADAPGTRWVGRCWTAGIVLFSGSLYALSLGAPKALGPVTPLGGVALIAGWLLLAGQAIRTPAR